MADLDELWRTWSRTRSVADRNAIILAAQPNIASSVRNIKVPSWVERSDLESEGQFGIIKAIEEFDPGRGANFSTFTNRCIRNRVLESLRTIDRVPKRVRSEARRLEAAEQAVASRHHRSGTDAEIAAELRVDEEELLMMRRRQIGLEIESYSTSDDAHAIPAPHAEDALFDVDEVRARIAAALLHVTNPRHRVLLALHFVDGLTGPEIGQVMGLSKGQVSKIRDQAMLALRAGLEAQRG